MSADDIEEVSFSNYLGMARIALKGMEELHNHVKHVDPSFYIYNDSKVKVLEEQLSDAYDLIKVLAYLYENSYITIVNMQQPTSSTQPHEQQHESIHESPLDKMKRVLVDNNSLKPTTVQHKYSPKLKRRVLPDEVAAMIRTLLEAGVPNNVIAKQLNVDSGIISGIGAGLTYRGVELPITEEQEDQQSTVVD